MISEERLQMRMPEAQQLGNARRNGTADSVRLIVANRCSASD